MTVKTVLTSLLILGSIPGFSQLKGLKDKMKNKINSVTGKDSTSSNTASLNITTESQDLLLSNFASGEYNQFYGPNRLYMYQVQVTTEQDKDKKTTRFYWTKDKGYGDKYLFYPKKMDGSDHIYAFKRKMDEIEISCSENHIFAYKGNDDPNAPHGYKVSKLMYVHGSFMKPKAAIEYIEKQRGASLKKIEADRQAKINAEKERRKKYTLEGKSIKQIIAVWPDNKPKMVMANESYNLGFEVIFSDGSKDKTLNLGGNLYPCDFKIEETNATTSNFDSEYKTWGYGRVNKVAKINVKEPELGAIDEVSLNVSSKYDGKANLEIKLPITYSEKGELFMGGQDALSGMIRNQGGGRGGHGMHIKVELKSYKHSATNQTVYIYKCTNTITNTHHFGRFTGKKFHIDVSGGAGGDGAQGSDSWDIKKPSKGGFGGNGGRGGKIELIVDSSASGVAITNDVSGGSGGSGGTGGYAHGDCPHGDAPRGDSGRSGTAGSFAKKAGNVRF